MPGAGDGKTTGGTLATLKTWRYVELVEEQIPLWNHLANPLPLTHNLALVARILAFVPTNELFRNIHIT